MAADRLKRQCKLYAYQLNLVLTLLNCTVSVDDDTMTLVRKPKKLKVDNVSTDSSMDSSTDSTVFVPLYCQVEQFTDFTYINCAILNSIPQYYIKTSTHQAIEKIALDESQTNRVALVGAKGTGKTTCLVAIWELCKRNDKHVVFTSTNAVRLHDTEVVRQYTRDLVKGFDKYKEEGEKVSKSTRSYVSFLYKFVNYLCINTDKKVVLLIDFGKFNKEDNTVI